MEREAPYWEGSNLKIIKDIGFDFAWDEKKVWELDVPVTFMNIEDLKWHFEVPFWNEKGKIYNLAPNDVTAHPDEHPEEAKRIEDADTSHPLDVMENKGRWLLLDGLHRLVKLAEAGVKEVQVRIIPRDRIPDIMKYEETVRENTRTLKEDEHYPHVYEWTDPPGEHYEEHAHEGRVSFFVVEGSITMTIDGEERVLTAGDRIDIPPGTPHTGVVGSKGCSYIVGEEIQGDT